MSILEKYKNLTSTYSNTVIAIFMLALILIVLPVEAVSKFTAWFAQFPVILLMCIVSTKAYQSLAETGSPEFRVWRILMLAGYSIFVGEIFFVFANFTGSPGMNLTSAILKLLAYIFFILGLWAMVSHVRDMGKKSNLFLPILAVFVVLASTGYLLFNAFSASQTASNLTMWANIGFLVPDFLLLVIAIVVTIRTYGGKLSPSYMVLGVGCFFLILYHVVGSFLTASGVSIFNHPVQILLLCAMTALAVGSDMRLKLELLMRKF